MFMNGNYGIGAVKATYSHKSQRANSPNPSHDGTKLSVTQVLGNTAWMTDIPDDAQHYIECETENCERYGELYCNCCHRQLCKQCRDDHLKSPDNKNHDVVPYLSRNRKLPEEKCKSHPTKDLDLLCQECQIPLCSKCVTQETHKGHTFDDLEQFYLTNYSSCQEKLLNVENYFLPTSKELRSEIQDDAKEIKKIMGNIRAEVKTDATSLKYLVDEVMSETLEGVDRFEEKLLEEITLQDKTIEEHIAYLLELKGEYQAYQLTKITDITVEHSKMLEIRPIPETTKPVTPTYTAGQYSKEDISNLLGKLNTDQTEPEIRDIKALASSKKLKRRHPEASKVKELTIPGVECLFHISLDKSEKVWASNNKGNLVQADFQGKKLKIIFSSVQDLGYHTVTPDGDLLYIAMGKERKVIKKISMDTEILSEFIRNEYWEPISIHSSCKSGEILVGLKRTEDAKVMKYSNCGSFILAIHRDKNGEKLYNEPHYITENINGDICTSDSGKKEVVVVNEAGQYRFSYRGRQLSFYPYGICTDSLGHIIVCDVYFNNGTVDLLDQNGQFLSHLLSKPGTDRPSSVCVDDQDTLYVGRISSNTIKVYKYLM